MFKLGKGIAAVVVALIGVPVIFHWNIPNSSMGDLFFLWIPMQINTAVAIICLGSALLLLGLEKFRCAQSLAFMVFAIGCATTIQYLTRIDLGIDQILRVARVSALSQFPGRMALNTALSITASGLAIFILASKVPKGKAVLFGGLLGVIPGALGLLKVLSFLFGIAGSLDPASFLHMALPTACAVFICTFLIIANVVTALKHRDDGELWLKPLGIFCASLFCALAMWQTLLNQEMIQVGKLIGNRTDFAAQEVQQRLVNVTTALQRFANRIEYLGLENKEFISLDARAYLEHISIIKRLGIINKSYKVHWSFPPEIRNQVNGFDQSEHPLRKEALFDAQQNQKPSLSHRIELRSRGSGFLLPIPINSKKKPLGFVYVTIEANRLFQGIVDTQDFQLAIQENGSELLINKSSYAPMFDLTQRANLNWGLARFQFIVTPSAHFVQRNKTPLPNLVLFIGSLFSILLGFALHLLLRTQKNQKALLVSNERLKAEDERTSLQVSAKAAHEASRLKSDFLANMSHEIRTPLNAILGMSELILETKLDSEQQTLARTVNSSGKHLLTVINDILDFSKIEAGKLELELIDFNLTHLVESSADLLVPRVREKGLSIMTYIDPSLPVKLRGDPGRIGQILMNFIGNAVKFTSKGYIAVRAQAGTTALQNANSVSVKVIVEDSGIGIPANALKRLFQPFSQADNSTTRKFGGTGLGLSISKNLVDLMGGKIGIESVEGKGSSFWFECEFSIAGNLAVNQDLTNRPGLVEGRNPKVLVVDDDPPSGDIMQTYIKNWGMKVLKVDNGLSGLELLRSAVAAKEPFDLVIIDRKMLEMDGFALAERIRSDVNLCKLPMILVTAFDRRAQTEQALKIGFIAILQKPLKQSELYNGLVHGLAGTDRRQGLVPSGTHAERKDRRLLEKRKERILVAEDVAANQMLIGRYLEVLGYSHQVVADGQAVLDAMGSSHFDAILMDCQMPRMDGYEATKKIREMEKETGHHITIIALTANAMKEDEKKCTDAGMDGFLSKPLRRDKLEEVLRKWFSERDKSASSRKAS